MEHHEENAKCKMQNAKLIFNFPFSIFNFFPGVILERSEGSGRRKCKVQSAKSIFNFPFFNFCVFHEWKGENSLYFYKILCYTEFKLTNYLKKDVGCWIHPSVASVRDPVLESAVSRIGSEKILFGADTYDFAFRFERIALLALTKEEKETIVYKNALRLFGNIEQSMCHA